ncbi:MAG: tRNA (adenosine(37)-N6)-threonylcarbamoyltransferase complex dimerization subunit type 1 TsaB [Candidatus Omnitrophica bacterium]|nr:tRNA (adenosine(37)-N6)-threonylcarbamoyltransferase complex dimerization subunit type 1 TsaB [Candidatus Omnitrophota bacterium]
MRTLAFDTSTEFLSVALLDNDKVKAAFHENVGIKHSEVLIPTISALLKKAKWSLSDVELICVGLGPGSFTGLRIAVTMVKGLSLSLKVKVVGVPTMDAIVENAPKNKKIVAPFLDAHKEKIYTCIYRRTESDFKKETDYLLLTVEELVSNLKEKVFFFGSGIKKYKDKLETCPLAEYSDKIDWYPRADVLGRLGQKKAQTKTDDPETLEPLYLHPKECNIVVR